MFNKFKRLIPLMLMGIATGAIAVAPNTQSVQRLGPFFTSTVAVDTSTGGGAGGMVHMYRAGTGTGETLFIGDVVYDSAAAGNTQGNTVFKSATITAYNRLAGVVVGGTFTGMRAAIQAPGATDTAAFANQQVVVLQCGRTWVKVDAAAGIAAGNLLWPSTTTAGKVKAMPAVPDSFYRAVGRLVDTGIVSTSVLANVCIK